MPNWADPPDKTLDDALAKIMAEIEHDVAGNPSFESVVGLKADKLMNHAVQAVATYIASSDVKELRPESLIHVYTLGFVVGVKYGEARQESLRDRIT